jgi:hypothetical protein
MEEGEEAKGLLVSEREDMVGAAARSTAAQWWWWWERAAAQGGSRPRVW